MLDPTSSFLFLMESNQGTAPLFLEAIMTVGSLFGNLLTGVILGNTQKAPIRSRKVIEVGLTNLLAKSDGIFSPTNTPFWYVNLYIVDSC